MRRFSLRADLLVLAWVVPTFLLLESFEVRFLRYVFPLMPFLILMGARMLFSLVDMKRSVWGKIFWVSKAARVIDPESPAAAPLASSWVPSVS